MAAAQPRRTAAGQSRHLATLRVGNQWSFTFRFKVRRRLTEAVKWWGEPIGIVAEIVPRFAFNLRHCPRTPAPSGQKKCPERTGLLLGTKRHWSPLRGAERRP